MWCVRLRDCVILWTAKFGERPASKPAMPSHKNALTRRAEKLVKVYSGHNTYTAALTNRPEYNSIFSFRLRPENAPNVAIIWFFEYVCGFPESKKAPSVMGAILFTIFTKCSQRKLATRRHSLLALSTKTKL